MGNLYSYYAGSASEPSDLSEASDVSDLNQSFDSMDVQTILAFVKSRKFKGIKISDSFADDCASIELENRKIIPIALELHQKLLELLGEYTPPPRHLKPAERMMFFMKPKFSMSELEEFLNTPTESADPIPFDSSLLVMPTDTSDLFNPMEVDVITLQEFDDAFGKKLGKKDMIGLSKLILKMVPTYIKRRIITALNRHYFNPELAASTPSIVRVSYLYKVARKGPLDSISSFRQIVSVNNMINHFHRILGIRFSQYMIKNQILDTTIQKGGIKGIKSAIVEQVFKIKSVLKEANASESPKPCVLHFLDISNAFGSVRLDALYQILELYGADHKFIQYLKTLYSNLTYHVGINGQTSSEIKWIDGLIQGCPLSPTLFVTLLNYVLVYLDTTLKETHGYAFDNGTKILLTAFVDDICIICNSVNHAQEVLDQFVQFAQMLGLPLNRSKSAQMMIGTSLSDLTVTHRSLSLADLEIVDTFKYLGEYVSADGTSSYSYNQLLCWTIHRLKSLNKKKCSLQRKADIFNEFILPNIQKKSALMYDISTSKRYQLLFIVKKYALKWINQELPLFIDISPLIEKSSDTVINSLPDELFDTDLSDNIDLTNHIFKNDSFRLKYNDDDEIIIDAELENLSELAQ